MQVIYTYKKLDHFKPINHEFLQICELSVKSAKKFYKTTLYCDDLGKDVLSSIPFDDVIVLDSLNDYNGMWYTVPKMITMSSQSEPFIHIDLDVLIFNKFDTECDIAIGFPEVNENYLDNEFILNSYKKPIVDIFKFNLNQFKFDTIPNTSIVVGKNPYAIKKIYSKILNDNSNIVNLTEVQFNKKYNYSNFGIPSVLDQFLFYDEILKSEFTFEFIDDGQDTSFTKDCAYYDIEELDYDNLDIIFQKSKFSHIPNYQEVFQNENAYHLIKKCLN